MKRLISFLLGFILIIPVVANAGIVLMGTRVLVKGDERQQVIRVMNNGDLETLYQAWVDTDSGVKDIPFSILPSVGKLGTNNGYQNLRIIYQGTQLPDDKESLFWLNVQEIPKIPKDVAEGNASGVTFAIRQRIKLLYRPSSVTTTALEATYLLNIDVDNSSRLLSLKNNTGNFITLVGLQAGTSADSEVIASSLLIEPFSLAEVSLSENINLKQTTKVFFRSIDDSGRQSTLVLDLVDKTITELDK